MMRPCCATCQKPLRRWRGGHGLDGRGRFCSAACAVEWAQNDSAALLAASADDPDSNQLSQ